MRRYTHDGAGSVVGKNIVGNPNRSLLTIHRIDNESSGKDAGLIFIRNGHSVYIGLVCRFLNILLYLGKLLRCRNLFYQRMFRSKNQEGCPVKRIGSCGKNGDFLFGVLQLEIHLCTVRTANPLGLHLLHLFRPVQRVQIIE